MADKIISEELDFDDVSIRPNRSSLNSRSEVDLFRELKWTSSSGTLHILRCKTLCAANMGTVGTLKMARELSKRGYLCALEKHYSAKDICALYDELEKEALEELYVKDKNDYTDKIAISIGIKESLDVIEEVSKSHKVNIVNIDVPNGYCPKLLERVQDVRKLLPECFIIAGSVVTGDIVTDLIQHGANCIRCGICAGSVCLTALKTGVRRPLVTMLMECADAAHNLNAYIMLDGGIRCPADWCKALVAGADLCMSGSVFAGTDIADGEIIEKTFETNELNDAGCRVTKTKLFKAYYGMSSDYAQKKFFGGIRNYRTSEGREKLIPYIGSLDSVLKDYEGGLASMMCYIGAKKMKHIPRHGHFYRVHQQLNMKFSNCEDFES